MRWLFIALFLIPNLGLAAPGCVQPFDEFLSRFETDRYFQEENIVFPLIHSFVDVEADPEPKLVDKRLSKKDVLERATPIFPSRSAQKQVPFDRLINSPVQTKRIVQFQKPDTGYLLIYHFQRIGDCWKLVEFKDASI